MKWKSAPLKDTTIKKVDFKSVSKVKEFWQFDTETILNVIKKSETKI